MLPAVHPAPGTCLAERDACQTCPRNSGHQGQRRHVVGQSVTPNALRHRVLAQECLFLEGSFSRDHMMTGTFPGRTGKWWLMSPGRPTAWGLLLQVAQGEFVIRTKETAGTAGQEDAGFP